MYRAGAGTRGGVNGVAEVGRNESSPWVGQHGLEIVLAVAQGFEAQREPVGKRITARLALMDIPDRAPAGQKTASP